MGLFRQQVISNRRNRLQGDVVVLPRLSHNLLCLGVLCWLMLVAIFLTQANFSRRETVRGWLEPAAGLVLVYPQSEGKLAQLLVTEGERVVQNQPLAIINGDRMLTDGQHLETLLLAEYQQQKQALLRQLQRADQLGKSAGEDLAQRISAARLELQGLTAQITTLEQQAALTAKRKLRFSQLQREGHITDAELELLEEQQLSLK